MGTPIDPADKAGHTTTVDPAPRNVGKDAARRVGGLFAPSAQTEAAQELLAQMRLLAETTTAEAARKRGGIMNGVLAVRTVLLDSDGRHVASFGVGCGSILVTNTSGATVTVQSGSATDSTAPATGTGVQKVPNSTWLAVPIGAHAFTLYGAAGGTVSYQAYTGLQALGVN